MDVHHTDLVGIALVVAVAVGLGATLTSLRMPAIVGYILAGVLLGPTGFGLVTQSGSIAVLAELGVLMLLFFIGMELSLKAFVRVLWPSTIVVAGQIAAAVAISMLFASLLDWSLHQALLIAFIVALSSTAAAIKILEDMGELRSATGQIIIGVLIAQDLAIVPMLIITESLGGEGEIGFGLIVRIVIALAILFGMIAFLSRRGKIRIPGSETLSGRVDLISLAALAACFSAAALTGVFGLSPAYGAFLAGLIIANSTLRAEAIQVTEPIQSVLIVIFFLSIGLLIDLTYILENWLVVLSFVALVIVVKTVLNVLLLRAVGEPWDRAFPGGLVMAQIGEFSFVLAGVGIANAALDLEGYKLAIAVIAISLLISPFWIVSVRRFQSIAARGVTDFRAVLREVYSDELHELEAGSAIVRRVGRSIVQRVKAYRGRRTGGSDPAA